MRIGDMATYYDAKTENGIEYVSSLYKSNYEYIRVVDTLDRMAPTVDGLYSGEGTTSSYTIGRRSKTTSNLAPSDMMRRWDRLWVRKRQLEDIRPARKTVGVLFRDW